MGAANCPSKATQKTFEKNVSALGYTLQSLYRKSGPGSRAVS